MTAAALPRVFRYNSVELEDPGLEHDPVDVRNLYSATYPEITSAAIEGPEVKDGKRVYTFRKAVGTKGNDVLAAPLWTEKQVAEYLAVSLKFVQEDRVKSRRIPFLRIGRCCRYVPEEVRSFVAQRKVGGPSHGAE